MRQMLVQQEILRTFPLGVTIEEVTKLVEVVESEGSMMELSRLVRSFPKQSTPHFLSVLKASQQLGLVRREGALVCLTDLGLGFIRASDSKEAIIRAVLARVEPFKTIIEMLNRKDAVTVSELLEVLGEKGVSETSLTELLLREMLIEWGVSSGLLLSSEELFSTKT